MRAAWLLLALLAAVAAAVGSTGRTRLERADFVFNNGAEIATLDPAATSGVPEGRLMYALYEGLTVKHPETLEPLPGMAESWSVLEGGRRYRFHLRRDARWSNGDPVGAEDFAWSWRRLLDPGTGAEYAYQLWCITGAREYTLAEDRSREEALWEAVGIHVPDEHTLEVELTSPIPYFLALTSFYATMPVHRASIEAARREFPETWQVEWLRPDRLVTNGPFRLQERRLHDRMRLVKNPLYWDAERVAFRSIDVLAVESYTTMLNLYLMGEVDWIERCAPNLVPRMMAREDFEPVPYLGSYFYRVNVGRPPFDDVRVRRALALAIDRRAIVTKVTRKGETPSWSLCPPGLAGYARAEMAHARGGDDEAYAADCEEARRLLSEAGFGPRKRRFPSFEIHYNKSESHRDIAEVVADTWRRVLGLDVQLLNQEWKIYLDTQRTFGYDVSRSAWIQDYPDPATFLEIFVTGGKNNRTGWSHPGYDRLIEEAGRCADVEERLRLLARAEAILLEELPILPLFAYTTNNAVNPRLGGFFENPQDDHAPKFWYWMDDEELASSRARRPGKKRVAAPGPIDGLYPPVGRDAVIRPRER